MNLAGRRGGKQQYRCKIKAGIAAHKMAERRKLKGLCPRCGKGQDIEGQVVCSRCRGYQMDRENQCCRPCEMKRLQMARRWIRRFLAQQAGLCLNLVSA